MLMADIIDVGVANRDTHYIFIRGILMIACAFFALLLEYSMQNMQLRQGRDLRQN